MADGADEVKSKEMFNTSQMEASNSSMLYGEDEPIYLKTENTAEDMPSCRGGSSKDSPTQAMDTEAIVSTLGGFPVGVTEFSLEDVRPLSYINNSKWVTAATALLLELYLENEDKFNSPNIKKKLLWRQIADKLNSEGHMFDAEKCERKFLNLKTTYRYTVDHNVQTGSNKRCAFYEQLDRILKNHVPRESGFQQEMERYNQEDSSREGTNETYGHHKTSERDGLHASNHVQSRHSNSQVERSSANSQNTPVSLYTNVHTSGGSSHMTMTHSPNQGIAGTSLNTSTSHKDAMPERRPSHFSNQHLDHQRNHSFHVQKSQMDNAHRSQHVDNAQRLHIDNSHRSLHIDNTHRQPPTKYHQAAQQINPRQHHVNVTSSYTRQIDDDDEDAHIPSSSGLGRYDDNDTLRYQRGRKRKHTELDYLLSTFEKYRAEQREREEKRLATMKELHEEEMKVMNRFLDIIQQSIQSGKE